MKKLVFLCVSLALATGFQPVRAATDEAPSCRVQGRYSGRLLMGWTAWNDVDAGTLEECAAAAEALLGDVVTVAFPTFGSGTTTATARIKRGKFNFSADGHVTEGFVKNR